MRHAEFGNPTFCKILPELPKPEKLRRQIRKDGGYDMVPAYSPEEMYKYGEACIATHPPEADKLLKDALEVWDLIIGAKQSNLSPHNVMHAIRTYLEGKK